MSTSIDHLSPDEQRALLAKLLVKKAQRPKIAPLSPAQERLWVWEQLVPNHPLYNLVQILQISGTFDVAVLEKCLAEIIRRHESLRTSFKMVDNQPRQVIHPPTEDFKLPVIDFSPTPKQSLGQYLVKEAKKPFDLTKGPPLQFVLLRSTDQPDTYTLFFKVHHIIFDGWSFQVINSEITALYMAYITGNPSPLPSLPLQYRDFAVWQRERVQGEILERHQTYWQQQLAGLSPLELPVDYPRSATTIFPGARIPFTLPAKLLTSLETLSRQQNVTLFVTLLTALQVLLARYTKQEDIAVGIPAINRNYPGTDQLIGFFINNLLIRSHISPDESFRALLQHVQATTVEAQAHQDISVEQAISLTRETGQLPPAQVIFIFQRFPKIPEKMGALWEFVDVGMTQTDLTLYCYTTGSTLKGYFEYNTDLFAAATIERMIDHFQTLLKNLVAHPDQAVSKLPLMTDAEQHQLLITWNDTQAPYPNKMCLHHLFEAQVKRTPQATALINDDSQLTYQQLNTQANRLAHYLQSLGVGPETIVGVCLNRSLEMVISLLGILKAGGAYVPLDPGYPTDRLAFMLDDTRIPILLTQRNLATNLPNHHAQTIYLDSNAAAIQSTSPDNPVSEVTPANAAYVIYTSGSTGRPKGVVGLHRGMVNRLAWMWKTFPFEPGEVCCQKTSLNFVDSIAEIFSPLLQGLPLVIIPDDTVKDMDRLIDALNRYQVTRLVLVPSLLRALLDTRPNLQNDLPQLKHWVTSGETISPALCRQFYKHLPNSLLLNLYGSSEVSADVTWYDTRLAGNILSRIPIGRPIDNTEIYLLNRYLHPVPVGGRGELYVGGAGLAREYLNRPKLTAERFVAHPFNDQPDAKLYKTGDLARYRPDGTIEFLGRGDQQIKIRGFRVELGEIEAVLTSHPAVQQAVLTVQEDTFSNKRLVAYITSHPPKTDIEAELRQFLKQKLPGYMIPAVFVPLEKLPLTPSGKIDRQNLPAPGRIQPRPSAPAHPRTTTEKFLADILAGMLDLPQVSMHDNFFELGGNSLLATQVIAQVRQTFKIDLSVQRLFDAQTVADMASIIEQTQQTPPQLLPPHLIALQTEGAKPPLFFIHPLAGVIFPYYELALHLGLRQPIYGLQSIGIADEAAPLSSVETMATHYLEAIRLVQPQGPYYLVGWSLGGLIALDMARQLQHAGQSTDLLAIIDTPLYVSKTKIIAQGTKYFFFSVLPYLWPYVQQYLYLRRASGGQIPWWMNKLVRQTAQVIHQEIDLTNFKQPELGRLFKVLRANIYATSRYVPQPYTGPVILFQAKSGQHDLSDGWSRIATGRIETHQVSGHHMNVLRPPHVQEIAKKLSDCLMRLSQGLSSTE